tara:strand:- start:373 stop:1365 length:993 start_codon:yes stop_codon:yes gene_type:complete
MAVLGAAAGGGGGELPTISFLTSRTWAPSYDLTAYVYVIGGGGSGGATHNTVGGACGGGAGGCAVSKLDLTSGTTYTIAIGAGGAAAASTGTPQVGNTGGATTFSGSGISTMTANGGVGGIVRAVNNATYAAGAAGGSATGGTLGNFTGGKGAEMSSSITGTGAYVAGGGGAVGLWQTGNDAPDGTSSYNVGAMGGMTNVEKNDLENATYYNQVTSQHHTLTGYPSIPPFTNVFTTELTQNAVDNNYNYGLPKYTNDFRDSKARGWLATNLYGGQSAPFSGAGGMSEANGQGQRGCAGSGGGGSYMYSSSTYSGAGGNGLVLIFPIKLGS